MSYIATYTAIVKKVVANIVLGSYLIGLGSSLALGAGYYFFGSNNTATQNTTSNITQASKRTIAASVKATGEVTFANEQQLRFNQKGKVTNVYFKTGDKVKKGQLIAQLDTSSIAADIRQAQLSVSASNLQLQQLSNDKQKTILDAQNSLRDTERQMNQTKDALSIAKETLPTDLASAKRTATEKEAAVKQAEIALDQAKKTTIQDLGSTAQSILASTEDLLDTLYSILVNDSSARRNSGNKSIEIYYRLYTDIALKNQTESNYYAALQATSAVRNTYGNTFSSIQNTTKLSTALNDVKGAANTVYTLADSMYQLLQGATDDPHNLTVADINNLKQSTLTARTSALNLVTKADTMQISLTSDSNTMTSVSIQQKTDALQSAQNALLSAQENVRILESQTPADLVKQEAALAKIQDDYTSKQLALNSAVQSTNVNLQLKQNDVAQKATSLIKTKKTLEDYQLTAPFDGVIRQMDYQVGDNLLDTGEDKLVILENPDFIVITILLDQVDIVRVKKDMTANITLDAIPGQTFTGSIYAINSTPVKTSGVVSYEVDIRLPTPKDLNILSGMTATIQIETLRKDAVLAIPNLALQYTNGKTTVTKADGTKVPVETGATDGRYTEIISGLIEGDSIQAMNVTVSGLQTSSNANTAQQLFRMGGGGGGGGGFTSGGGRGTTNTGR